MNRLTRASIAVIASLFLYSGIGLASWKPELKAEPTAQESLEALDRALLPVIGKMDATFADLSLEGDEQATEALVTIVQRTAAKGYGIVAQSPYHACSMDYRAVLLSGFLLLGDSVDSFRAQAPEFSQQLNGAAYLLGPYATLVRDVTDCGGAAEPTAAPRPSASP